MKVIEVQPVKTATYKAVQWDETEVSMLLMEALALENNFRINGITPAKVFGRKVDALTITGKNRKQYRLLKGDWLVILGKYSIRTCSDATFQRDYEEIGK